MRLCVFEDRATDLLEPLTLTRPAFDLRCGTYSLLERHQFTFPTQEAGILVRPSLAELCRTTRPDLIWNDYSWLRAGPVVLVNARWLPTTSCQIDPRSPVVGVAGNQLAYAVLPADLLTYCSPNTLDECLDVWKQTLPQKSAGGVMIDYPWDLIEQNADAIRQDFARRRSPEGRSYPPASLTIVGPSDQVLVEPGARIDPLVVADTTNGPVIIDRDAVVHAFTRLEGPCYIGSGTVVLGAKVRKSSIGPVCRIGGEVEATIIQGFTNKYHDGFLGHSYVGEWVNLAAGTQVSDLRNDYQSVSVAIAGERVDTGLTKVGAFIGDFTRTGLDALLNTGSVVGAFCNILPTGAYAPRLIPSFCTSGVQGLVEGPALDGLLATAATVTGRRECELTDAQTRFFKALYQTTAPQRHHVLRGHEQRLLRRSA